MELSTSIFKNRIEEALQPRADETLTPPAPQQSIAQHQPANMSGSGPSEPGRLPADETPDSKPDNDQPSMADLLSRIDDTLKRPHAPTPEPEDSGEQPINNSDTSGGLDELVGRQRAFESAVGSQLLDLQDSLARLLNRLDVLAVETVRQQRTLGQEVRRAVASLSNRLEGALTELRALLESQPAASPHDFALLSAKLDSYATDMATRQEGLQALAEAHFQGFSDELTHLTGRIRPPVLQAGDRMLLTQVDGFVLCIPAEDWRQAAYYVFYGTLEKGLSHAFQNTVRAGMTVVDVGANIGIYTLYAARMAGESGKVYSFEPAPRAFQALRSNALVNGLLESGRVELHELALLNCAGTAQFHLYPNEPGLNTLYPGGRETESIIVRTAALDDVLPPGTPVHVVKLDAEGAEPLIFGGMKRVIADNPNIRIFMEFAPSHLARARVDPGEFLAEITAMGFSIERVDDITGELLPVCPEHLISAFSANLLLQR